MARQVSLESVAEVKRFCPLLTTSRNRFVMSELLLQSAADMTASATLHGADARLMQRLASGDQTAMEELIAEHGEWLARLVGRLSAWSGSQDDLLQEVLLAVWQQADSYRGQGPLAGWLRTVAVNRCRNHRRHLKALRRLMESAKGLLRISEPSHAGTIEAADLTRAALGQLSVDDRTLIVLFYLEEIPGNEIADLLKIKTKTLHVRLHRARARMKTIIEQIES